MLNVGRSMLEVSGFEMHVSTYKPFMKGALYASQQTARKKSIDTALSGQA
jgi:hypothetical protein